MSDSQSAEATQREFSREEMMSALFAQLVVQQANMAMMLLGKTAHPQTGEVVKDLETARLFIDQLEMLEAKTKGNLTKEEAGLLKQSLMSSRLAFVQAVESSEAQPGAKPAEPTPVPSQPAASVPEAAQPSPAPEESHKKFSKKY